MGDPAGPAPGRSKSDRDFLKWSIGIALVVTMVLLVGEEYERQKRIYAEGMVQIAAGLRRRAAASLARHRREVYLGGAQVGVALLIILFVWLNVLRMVRARLAERRRAEEELRKYHGELEQRVGERTADLKAAQGRLRIAHNKLVNAREQERRRLARELHDSIGQRMIAMRLNLDDARTELPPSEGQGLPDRLAELSEQCLQTIEESGTSAEGSILPRWSNSASCPR